MTQLSDLDRPDVIEAIRAASRQLVREFGFLRATLAETELPPSAVHALVEIDAAGGMTARELGDCLLLEKSSVSRMLGKLIAGGLVHVGPGERDGRTKRLSLTRQGEAVTEGIHRYARRQVEEALGRLEGDEAGAVLRGLRRYADALAAGRGGGTAKGVRVAAGYRPGLLARCVELHATWYARAVGFGRDFEAAVAGGLAKFAARLDRPCNQIWWAELGGEVVGTVAIDGEDLGPGCAHLRWFIVAEGARGRGVGRGLLREALAFVDRQGFAETQLWTFPGLDAARRLYEAAGFALAEERLGRQWGEAVMEQRFVRRPS
jgi:DNA-binding MarR family transcriptional regulator/GNAT superfamily N-acetyltransferase